MINKYTLPIIIVSFLIGETLLIGFNKIYLDRKSRENASFQVALDKRLSLAIASLAPQNINFTWENGKKKKSVPLSQLVVQYRRAYDNREGWRIDTQKLEIFLGTLAAEINIEPKEAVLIWKEKEYRVKEFSLPQAGRELNVPRTINYTTAALMDKKTSIPLVIETLPSQPLTDKGGGVLDFSSLLAEGKSDFNGSSSNRTQNIGIGAGKLQGLVIKPGEVFSFNGAVGAVDAEDGYKAELVIKNGRTVYEYGGGLCQVSTTLFRAAILAGLPVIERKGHSLPVRYYNPQGFDATVYPRIADLKFKNDTPGYLLIQRQITGTVLSFKLYGSSDGRQTTIAGPLSYPQPNGTLKTVLTRNIHYANGLDTQEEFKTTYLPALAQVQRNPLE